MRPSLPEVAQVLAGALFGSSGLAAVPKSNRYPTVLSGFWSFPQCGPRFTATVPCICALSCSLSSACSGVPVLFLLQSSAHVQRLFQHVLPSRSVYQSDCLSIKMSMYTVRA